MQRIPRQIRLAFFPVLAIALAIAFFLVQASVDLLSLSTKYVVINAVLAILVSLAATILFLGGYFYVAGLVGKTWRRLLGTITLYTLNRAVSSHARVVQAIGIGEQRASVVVRLGMGSSESVTIGDKFGAVNAATREKLGVLEVIEVEGDSCLCSVYNRINEDFWIELESRMRRDPSPPAGVTFVREVNSDAVEFVERLLRNWGE